MFDDIILTSIAFIIVLGGLAALGIDRGGSFAVVAALVVATWCLHTRGESWQGLGLRAIGAWWTIPVALIGIYLVILLANALLIAPLARAWDWPPQDLVKLGAIEGNPRVLLVMLVVAWTTAAFSEGLLFRAFLLTCLEALFGGGALALGAAIVFQALLFGVAHLYLGTRGAVTAAIVGVVMGCAYLLCRRNLWPLVVSHGVIDSVSLIALYAGVAPRAD